MPMHPKPSADTSSPLVPNVRMSMVGRSHFFAPLGLLTRSSIHLRMRSAICRLFLSCMIMWLLPRMPRSGGASISA